MRGAAMLAAALALAGCLEAEPGEVAGDADASPGASDASPGGTADGGVADAGACGAIVEDLFDGSELDATTWSIVDEGEAAITAIDQASGELTIQVQLLVTDTYANIGVLSITQASIAGTTLDVSIVQLSASAGARAGLGWSTDGGDYVAAYLEDGALVAARGDTETGEVPVPFCTGACPTYLVGDPDRVRLRANDAKILVEVHDANGWTAIGSTPNDLDGPEHVALFTTGNESDEAKGAFGEVIWACDTDPLP